MITGIVGTLYDDLGGGQSIRRNGKTATATRFGYEAYVNERAVYTNYHTVFSKYLTSHEMLDLVNGGDLHNTLIIIDEVQRFLNSLGTKGSVVKFVDDAISQTGKDNIDVMWTSQRFGNVHARLRVQTEIILQPQKYHYTRIGSACRPREMCPRDKCPEDHIIAVYLADPPKRDPIKWIIASEVGKLYNTREHLREEFTLPKKK